MSKLEVDAIEPQSGTTLTLGASGDSVNIASGATITDFTSTGIDDNATSTAITIDSSENVGIGITPTTRFTIGNPSDSNQIMRFSFSDSSTAQIDTTRLAAGNLQSFALGGQDNIKFLTNASERMRLDSAGNLMLGQTTQSINSLGVGISTSGFIAAKRDNGAPLLINRGTNDGTLVSFRQDDIQEGAISVSGSTVTYGGFTGTHWSRFTDNSKPTILKGTVLESLDEMCDWYNLEFDVTTTTQDEDGNDVTNTEKKVIPHVLTDGQSNGDVITYDWNTEKKDENDNDIIEQVQATIVKEADIKHMKSKVSDTVDAKNVYGVFMAYDEDGEGYNDFYVASVGSFVVRIKQGETVAKGDLLQSNGDGTAKVQTDDNVKSSSFAKVLSTTVIETYEDGSFLVPCSLMC